MTNYNDPETNRHKWLNDPETNHYKWLELHLEEFFKKAGLEYSSGIIVAHGDKFYTYRCRWEDAGIKFAQGVAIGLLSYCRPYSTEVRNTKDGWVAVDDWVIANYERFKKWL